MKKKKNVTKRKYKRKDAVTIGSELPFTALAIVMGKKYIAEGKTASEAIGGIKIKNARGKCILTVSQGKRSRERVLMPFAVNRIFNAHGITREIALKGISMLFV